MRYFNWKLAIVLLLGFGIIAGTVVGLHYFQNSGRYKEYYEQGMDGFKLRQWQDAATSLGKCIAKFPKDIEVDEKIAVLHDYAEAQLKIRPSKSANVQQALGSFREILRYDSGNRAAARQLVDIYLQRRRIGEAQLVAQRFLEDQEDAVVERLLAEALIVQREFDQAYKMLQAVIEAEPNQIAAYERLAGITEKRPDEYEMPAAHWLDLAIENNQESPSAYLARARFNLSDRGKTLAERKALVARDLETALTKTFSDDPEEHMAMAWLCRVMEQMDRVQERLGAIQELERDHLGMWIFRAGMALVSQDKDKMRQVADEGLASLNENKWGFYALATELYVRAEAFDQATACLDILKNQDDRSAEVAFLEGLSAIHQDHVQEAVLKWQRALALGYSSPPPSMQYYLGFKPVSLKLLLASALEQLGDSASSRQLLESVASDNKDDVFVQATLARHMARIGDWTQTKVHAQRVLNIDPNNRDAIQLNLEADVMLLVRGSVPVSPIQWQGIQQRVEGFEGLEPLEGVDEDATFMPLLKFQIALDCNEFDTAQEILKVMDPNDPIDQQKVTLAWVNWLNAQNRTDEIIARLKTAVEQHDQSTQMVRLLAYFLSQAGDVDAVEQVLRDAMARMEKPSNSLSLGYLLSDFLTRWAKGETDQLVKQGLGEKKDLLLQRLDQDYPDTILVQRQMLQTSNVIDQPEQAQALIDKIRALEGEDGWQWKYEQAKLWFGFVQSDFQNKSSEAVSLLQQNLRSNGNDQLSRRLLAAIYDKAGQSSLALATYRNALEREPYNLSIVIPAVKALQEAKELDEADAILKRVAERDLADPFLDRLQVSSYLQRGQVTSAGTLMQEYLKDDPNNIGIAMALAKLKVSENEYVVAKAMFDKIKENTHEDSVILQVERLEIQMLMQQGLSDQALDRCNDLVAKFNDAESLELRCDVRVRRGEIDGAIEDLDKAIDYIQDDADLWVKKSRLCWLNKQKAEAGDDAEEAKRQKQEALSAMEKAILLAPKDPNVVEQAINLFAATQEPERVATAQALLEQGSRQDPDNYRFKVQKVRFMVMDGDAVSQIQAEALLEQLTIDHPKEAVGWLMLGDLLMSRKEYAKAQNVAIRGLTELKGNFNLLSLKARSEMEISPNFAVQTLEAMLEQAPDHVGVALNLAGAHIRAEKPEKAIEALSTYKELCTREVDVKVYEYTLLSALLDAEQEAEASALLADLKEKYPDDQSTIIVQIQHWIKKGELDAVKQEVMQWLEVNPEKTVPVEYAATVWLSRGQPEALEVSSSLLSAALEKQPKSESLLMILAQTCHVQRRVDKAADYYERVLKVNSRNVVAMNNVAWIYGQDLNQIERALQLAQKGLVLAPQYTDLLDTYGTLCYKAGQYDQAIKSLKECLNRPSYKSQDSTAATMYTLAKSYLARGDKTNARMMFRQCLDEDRQLESKGKIGLTEWQEQDAADQQVAILGN